MWLDNQGAASGCCWGLGIGRVRVGWLYGEEGWEKRVTVIVGKYQRQGRGMGLFRLFKLRRVLSNSLSSLWTRLAYVMLIVLSYFDVMIVHTFLRRARVVLHSENLRRYSMVFDRHEGSEVIRIE